MNAITDHTHLERPAIEGAVHIPTELLRSSATNPRKNFPAADIEDLAQSLKTHGQLQPILARPIAGAKAGEPLYEIVAGERRWRAARQAGLVSVMAIVRELTDFDVLEIQLIENLKRSDLSVLEEAEGYRQLLRKPDGLHGYASADELATRIGKSRSYVFQRLKLLDLAAPGRDALADGRLSFSIALLIARLPAADQPKATERILTGWGGEPMSFRDASQYIQRDFMLSLDKAAFRITDATLVPEAGSCRECPKRTGANPDLFNDVQKADTCADPACYRTKEEAHRAQLKAQAEAKGIPIVSGKEAKAAKPQQYSSSLKGFLKLDQVHYELGDKPLRKLLGKPLPEVLLFEDPHSHEMYEVVREVDAVGALKAAGKLKQARMPSTSASQRDNERKAKAENTWRDRLAQRCVEEAGSAAGAEAAYRMALLTEVAIVLWHRLDSDQTKRVERLMAWAHIGSEYADPKNGQAQEERIRALSDSDLCRFFTAATLSRNLHVSAYNVKGNKPEQMLRLAEQLGVDAEALRQEVRNESLARVPGKKAAAKKAAEPTPETALAGALKKARASSPPVKYRHPETGVTWSGRGLQPAWLKAAMADGKALGDFSVEAPKAPTPRAPRATLSAAAADPFRA